MGNCCTTAGEAEREPLQRKKKEKGINQDLKWESDFPLTEEEVLRKREIFWDTQPNYEVDYFYLRED